MALYDPDAAGNAAPYLRLDSVTLMEIKSAPFDGKTAVWVPYSETGYTKGQLVGGNDKEKKVKRLVDGKTKTFKAEDVEPQNPPKYELMEDMANMTYLSEASVVNNLNERYTRFLIYTYSGTFSSNLNQKHFLCRNSSDLSGKKQTFYFRFVLCHCESVQVAASI